MTQHHQQNHKNPKENTPADTKQLLMQISTELFQQKDFDRVSIDEICKIAGVTKGAFYHHFDSKYDIPVQQYREIQREFYEAYEKTSVLPTLHRFERAMMWYADYCTADKVNIIKNYHKVMINYDKNKVMRRIEMESKVFKEILSTGVKKDLFRDDMNVMFYSELISRFLSSLLLDWAIFDGNIDMHKELAYFYRNMFIMIIKG